MFVKSTPYVSRSTDWGNSCALIKLVHIHVHKVVYRYSCTWNRPAGAYLFKNVVCQVCVLWRVKMAYVTTDILHRWMWTYVSIYKNARCD